MAMIQASEAKVEWNTEKKHWQVEIHVGAEVIRRQCAKTPRDADRHDLRQLAIETAKDEGYDLDASHVVIQG
jgi:hypothetical protein